MPPYLPVELLLPIFTQIRDEPDSLLFPNLNLFSCSLVCRFWYQCAFPLLLEGNNLYLNRDINKHTNLQLRRLADLMTESKRYGLSHAMLVEWVEIVVSKLFVPRLHTKGLDRRRIGMIDRLLRALQPQLNIIGLNLEGISKPNEIRNLHDIVSKLLPSLDSVATLRITHLSSFPPLEPKGLLCTFKPFASSSSKSPPIPPPHPILPLIQRLAPTLQHLHLTSAKLTPPILQTLRACPNIRTTRFHRISYKVTPTDFADTVAAWPNLQHLSILHPETYIPLGETIALLASSRPTLQTLDLDNSGAQEPDSVYHNLRTLLHHSALTLTSLTLPAPSNVPGPATSPETSNALFAFLVTLPLPNLDTLDLSLLGETLTSAPMVDTSPTSSATPLPWPSLRRLDTAGCSALSPAFLRAVITDCPRLEVVRTSFIHREYDEVQTVLTEGGFVRRENRGEWVGMGQPWVKYRPGSYRGFVGFDAYGY
ncbi:hypothetical protein BC938DRAFT_478982 [Jimgerdemannia flammicorona]|uniref:F-box domain-containing protein n=1 Tax=Jimgerdemannia flammicorona TaxID=994334 RepID=A0A433QLW8_9FUNG|nr:hypothetical protein BC938DRAFT_478982 [Jimgerdemannia flammicorona]